MLETPSETDRFFTFVGNVLNRSQVDERQGAEFTSLSLSHEKENLGPLASVVDISLN